MEMIKDLEDVELDEIAIKNNIIAWVSNLKDVDMLDMLAELSGMQNQASLPPYVLSEAERESIERGLRDIEMGLIYPHSEVKKMYEKWL